MGDATKVAEGQPSAAAHFNAIIDDIKTHAHEAGEGTVLHSSLGGGAISGTYVDHVAISKHIQGSGTSEDPDADGGASGVHGLATGVYVAGANAAHTLVHVCGPFYTVGDDAHYTANKDNWVDCSFGVTFDAGTTPAVFVIGVDSVTVRTAVPTASITTTQCRVYIGRADDAKTSLYFKLLVIGVKSS
jgi:hypothetical protein